MQAFRVQLMLECAWCCIYSYYNYASNLCICINLYQIKCYLCTSRIDEQHFIKRGGGSNFVAKILGGGTNFVAKILGGGVNFFA